MIIVDTSALAAIFLDEPESARVQACMASSASAMIPISCIVEIAVLHRFGERRFEWLDTVLSELKVKVVGLEAGTAQIAVQAARAYGKGSGHPAQLNFGDCLSYAVAKSRDLPLLYVGTDFSHTDIQSALTQE
ncbi:MAG: type II toxin-antitoxin system VapC family toxin [Rhizobiaceae bacterium]|nr:type II toxin-antitoxin system VapC family toxin [Rhizobiaceae bacterium]